MANTTSAAGRCIRPIFIPSQSGTHNVNPGDPLPNTLASLLVGYPYSYTVAVAPPDFSNGAHIGPAAINRNDVNAYFQDTWKINDRWALDYGLRYEVYSPITERAHRTSSFLNLSPRGPAQVYVINPQPGYRSGWNGWGPRLQVSWNAPHDVHVHAGGAITVIPPNIWQDNFLTGSTPFAVYPRVNASRSGEIAYGFQITPDQLPQTYTPAGQNVFTTWPLKKLPANTPMDVDRYQHDLAALSPSHQLSLLSLSAIDRRFGDGFLQTWTLGLEKTFLADGGCGLCGHGQLPAAEGASANAYPGAERGFAPFTTFRQHRRGYGWVWPGECHREHRAFVVPRAADFALGRREAWRPGTSGGVYVVEVDRRYERSDWRNRIDGRDGAAGAAGSLQHAPGAGAVEFRRDARVQRERSRRICICRSCGWLGERTCGGGLRAGSC